MRAAGGTSVLLVRGGDPALVAERVRELLARLVGEEDPALVVDHVDGDTAEPGPFLDACRTLPMLSSRRVVVVREASALRAEVVAALASYLEDPSPSTTVVLVAGGGTVPQRLSALARKSGSVIDADPPGGRARGEWLAERVAAAPVRLDAAATRLLAEHVGDALGRIGGVLGSLAAAYGEGSRVGAEQLRPFLGEPGDVPPWELTDAIDRGQEERSLLALRRMTGPAGRHPLVVLALLHRHYESALRLEGGGTSSDAEAAAVLSSSPFLAGKALGLSRRLGHEGLSRAVCLLAESDLDLRGATGLPAEVVLEVLVGRLARMS
ncbi:MAG: DNA polymerase III subunit delta, partial [Acidimicrobiales bacterium]